MQNLNNSIVSSLLKSVAVNIDNTSLEIQVLSNEHYFLGYNPAKNYIVMEVFGYLTSPQFRFLCNTLSNLIIKTKINKLLIDATLMPIIGLEDQHWLNEYWIPKAIAVNHGACAIINSKYFFNRIAFDSIISQLDKYRFKVKTFADRAHAQHWLTSLNLVVNLGTS